MGTAGVLRGRDFRILVASTGLSSLGDELALIALTIKVADLTGSGWDVAALLLAGLLPFVIFAPAAGVIVDNFETRRTLIVASSLQTVLAVCLAFADGLPSLLFLSFLLGTVTAVENPTIYTLAPVVVGEEHATEGNAYLETARYVGMIAGPLLAGTLSAGMGSTMALLVNAGTFAVVGLGAFALRARRHPAGSEDQASEARAGFGVVRRDRMLLIGFAVVGLIVLFAATDNVAEVFFARDSLRSGSWGYGVLASAWIGGMVVGSSQIARRLSPSHLMPALALAGVVGGAAVALAGAAAVMGVAVVLFVVGGVANGVITVSMRSIIVLRVPDRFRGRVFAAYSGLLSGTQLAAMAIAGGFVASLGGRTVLVIGGIGTVVAGAVGLVAYRALPAEVRAMRGTPGEGAEERDGTARPDDLEVARALVAHAVAEEAVAAAEDLGPGVPERPDVTRIPEPEPTITPLREP